MKRKILMAILTVALTLALIPAISAFADTDGDGILSVFTEDQDQDQDVEEEVDVEDEEEAGDVELPKLNLKSPVSQFGTGDVGETFVLTARIGDETVDPLLVGWVSSDESVATVAPDGTVTIVGPGRAEITAVMLDGSAQSGKAKVFVLDNWPDKAKSNDNDDKDKGKGHTGGDEDSDDDSDEDAPDDEPSGDE